MKLIIMLDVIQLHIRNKYKTDMKQIRSKNDKVETEVKIGLSGINIYETITKKT